MELSRGQIVKSLSGRDKDRYFVVLADTRRVCLAGRWQRCENWNTPNAKRPSTSRITKTVVPIDPNPTDKQLRKLLHDYNYPEQPAVTRR